MIIGLLTIRLHIPVSNSLKEKRRVIKGLKDKLRNRFNISVSEIDEHDKWQITVLAAVAVSTDKANTNSILSNVLNFIEGYKEAEVVDHQLQLF